jgi:DNA-binding MarR family transcriptional regulator
MRGTYTDMTTTTDRAQAPAPLDPQALDHLDDALVEIRRVLQRPGYRRAVLGELAGTVGLQTIRVLRSVERAERAPTIGAVAEALAVDPSTASRTVDRAVAAGLLDRQPCSDDGRRARLQLTGAGQALLAEVSDRRRAVLARAIGDWEPGDVDRLQTLLGRLLDGFDAAEVAP